MPPSLATVITLAGVLFLLRYESGPRQELRAGLWLPLLWLGITGSRFLSQWLDLSAGGGFNFDEGSPLDAAFFLALMCAGVVVLVRRGVGFGDVVRANVWLVLFLAYGLLSVAWSDEPFIALKRWVKVTGHPIMVLVILSEPDPVASLRVLFKRLAYLLLPTSLLFIKYYPQYGRSFDPWAGTPLNVGVMLTKNDLGYVCMVLGLFFVWNLLYVRQAVGLPRPRRETALSLAFIGLAVWLLFLADSKTSLACLAAGSALMIGLGTPLVSKRHFGLWVVVTGLLVVWLESTFHLYDAALALLQRNPTLTDRTIIWDMVLDMQDRPWIGFGFESFWLGSRLEKLWSAYWWRPTQAHNGYIEIYLHLGVVGLALLLATILAAFRKIARSFRRDFLLARLQMALLLAVLMFNYAEASFKGVHFIWTIFYLVAMVCPRPATATRPTAARGLHLASERRAP
jgi:O-antigen ligase